MLKRVKQKAGFTPAFTMIELIFVIVVIGILSAIAIPKLAASKDDAILVKGKSQVASIRSGIAMQRNRRLLEGNASNLPDLDGVTTYNVANQRLFNFGDGNESNVLEYPIYSEINKDGYWVKSGANQYKFNINNTYVEFDYNSTSGTFDCSNHTSDQNCIDLTK